MRLDVERVVIGNVAGSAARDAAGNVAGDPAALEQAESTDAASDALAAIASTYEDARAGIISGEPAPSAGPPVEVAGPGPTPPGHAPTVRVARPAGPPRARPPETPRADDRSDTAGFWSRLLRRGGPPRAGRHSGTR